VATRIRKPRRAGSSEVEAYCRSKPAITASTPFGPEPLVFKVAGKMFALLGHLDGQPVVSLKCDPEQSLTLRATFPAITPGYHLNKRHWNTLTLDGSLPAALVIDLIDHAYELVAAAANPPAKKRSPTAAAKRPTAKR
jgi:predicted DNA-binding protein (MmcQ/YjbR family)